jgi:hypothetical protein
MTLKSFVDRLVGRLPAAIKSVTTLYFDWLRLKVDTSYASPVAVAPESLSQTVIVIGEAALLDERSVDALAVGVPTTAPVTIVAASATEQVVVRK